jgi:phosphoesterase RecJ-like protein
LRDIEAIVELFKSKRSFLLTAHVRPEGDSIGSQLGLMLALKSVGKKVVIANDDPVPEMFSFLPGSDGIVFPEDAKGVPDVGVVLDCGQWERVGRTAELIKRAPVVVNIDHHIDTEGLGKYNYIDPGAAATGEQVYEIVTRLARPDYDIALCLYVAIVSDTGGFRYSNTTADTHRVTAHLLELGVKPNETAYKLYESDPPSLVRAMGLALKEVQVHDGVAWTHLTKEALLEAGAWGIPLETEKIIRQVRTISGVRIVAFLTETENGGVKVNLRARPGFDVGTLAKELGGGGHRQASGCTLEGPLPEAERRVLDAIFARLGEGR